MSMQGRPAAPRRPRKHSTIGVPASAASESPKARTSEPGSKPDTATKPPARAKTESAGNRNPAVPRSSASTSTKGHRSTTRSKPGSTRRPRFAGLRPRTKSNSESAKKDQKQRHQLSLGGLSISVRVVAMTVILGLVGLNLLPIGMKWYQQEQEYIAVRAELADAMAQSQALQDQIDAWNNPNYVANQAKTRLGYVWPGEVQYNVVGLPDEQQSGEKVTDSAGKVPVRPWTTTILESMVSADQPSASSGSTSLVPTYDPNTQKPDAEQTDQTVVEQDSDR